MSLYTSEELNALRDEVHGNSVEKGWWPELAQGAPISESRYRRALLLVDSELSEAYEEFRKPGMDITKSYLNPEGKPEGFPIEMADAYIRVLDLGGATKRSFCNYPPYLLCHDGEDRVSDYLFDLKRDIHLAYEDEGRSCLDLILAWIEKVCERLGVDLKAAIEEKNAYNKTRPFRHGGKRA